MCRHNPEKYLDQNLAAAGITDDLDGPLSGRRQREIGALTISHGQQDAVG